MQGDGSANSQGKRLSIGNVTQPFLTQTYRAVAPYETKDTKNRPFKVDVDETLDVLIKDQKGTVGQFMFVISCSLSLYIAVHGSIHSVIYV